MNTFRPEMGFSLLLVLILGACQSSQKRPLTDIQQQFQTQLRASCEKSGSIYTKVVRDQNLEQETLKDTLGSDPTCPLEEELAFVIQEAYDDPVAREKYDIQSREDTVVAIIKSGGQQSGKLLLQKVLLDESGVIRYLESHLKSDSWLYKTQIRAWVSYDSTGIYQAHEINSYMSVATVAEPFDAAISGKLEPHE